MVLPTVLLPIVVVLPIVVLPIVVVLPANNQSHYSGHLLMLIL